MSYTSSTDSPPLIGCFCPSLSVHTSWWTTWCDHLDPCGIKQECSWVKFGYSWRWTPSQLPISCSPLLSFPDLCAEANPTHLQELRTLLPAKSPAVPPASSTTWPTPKKRERKLSVIKKKKNPKPLGLHVWKHHRTAILIPTSPEWYQSLIFPTRNSDKIWKQGILNIPNFHNSALCCTHMLTLSVPGKHIVFHAGSGFSKRQGENDIKLWWDVRHSSP